MAVTSYGLNKNRDDELNKKNQEKANNSLSYRFEAIQNALRSDNKHNRLNVGRIALERLVGALINCSLLQSGGGGR